MSDVIQTAIKFDIDDLAEFNKLNEGERKAFLGWFAGALGVVVRYNNNNYVYFGMNACSDVDFKEFWLGKVVDLGWMNVDIIEVFEAKTLIENPTATKYMICATDKGIKINNLYWKNVRRLNEKEKN